MQYPVSHTLFEYQSTIAKDMKRRCVCWEGGGGINILGIVKSGNAAPRR